MSSSLNCHYACGPKRGTGPGTARITLAWGFEMTHPATISVVICVYTEKRWNFILEAIASVRAQIYPAAEIIVVTDYNEPLRQSLAVAEPEVRVIPNGEAKGLAGGRNTGVASATGDFVAFLDDDAAADPRWLSFMMAHFDRDQVIGVGSRVDPWWMGSAPNWFPEEYMWVVGCSYRGLPETACEVRNVSGGAMVLRKSIFATVGGFTHRLGRIGTGLLSCEETEFCVRAHRLLPGSTFVFEPKAWIGHRVPADRITTRYFQRRCYAEGLSKSVYSQLVGRKGLSSEWRYTLLTMPTGVMRGLRDVLLKGDIYGFARALAICLGFGFAAAGFVVGRFTLGSAPAQTGPVVLGPASRLALSLRRARPLRRHTRKRPRRSRLRRGLCHVP